MNLNEHVKAFAYYEAQHATGTEHKIGQDVKAGASIGMGVPGALQIRADRQGADARASQGPEPRSHVSVSAFLENRVREAAKWLTFRGRKLPRIFTAAHGTRHLSMRAKRTRRWHISKSLSLRVQHGRGTYAGVGKRGATTHTQVVIAGLFFLFLLHNHFIKKKFTKKSGDVNDEANFSFFFFAS
jgi:hypothetical protein